MDFNVLGYNLVIVSFSGKFVIYTEIKLSLILYLNECEYWGMLIEIMKDIKFRDRVLRFLYLVCVFRVIE